MSKKLIIVVVAGLLMLVGSGQPAASESVKPGFDCTKAHDIIEIAICQNDELAATDAKLGTAYNSLRERLSPDSRKSQTIGQRAWLKFRRDACESSSVATCVLAVDQDRFTEIQDLLVQLQDGTAVPDLDKKLASPPLRSPAPTSDTERPPFVGCPSDGQTGPEDAPTAEDEAPSAVPVLPREIAKKLAYYRANRLAVLAPRGWHCFGLYGSNGAIVIVTPERHDAKDLLQYPTVPLKGPAIQLSFSDGETSGRFAVAETAARLFPNLKEYVLQIIAEGIRPATDFPFGPYPTDVLNRKNDFEVEFETPGHHEGMGTHSRLAQNGDPIRGIAEFSPSDDSGMYLLVTRLPSSLDSLSPSVTTLLKTSLIEP